jgi:hypothetical protein
MSEELISVIDVANHHGKRKQTIFKILRRLGIEARKLRSGNHGQFLSYITQDEFRLVSNELLSYRGKDASEQNQDGAITEAALAERGVFYLVQLEPDPSAQGRSGRVLCRCCFRQLAGDFSL